MDSIKNFHRIIFDTSRDDLFSVVDYLIDEFDLTIFWKGVELDNAIPDNVKLFVDDDIGNEPDLVGNPISWYICSDRLLENWLPLIEKDVQLCEAPIYSIKTKRRISGFKILNPIRTVEAMNLNKSKFIGNNKRIKTVSEFVFKSKNIPDNINIFRPLEFPKAIIISDELARKTRGIGVKGLAFVSCESH